MIRKRLHPEEMFIIHQMEFLFISEINLRKISKDMSSGIVEIPLAVKNVTTQNINGLKCMNNISYAHYIKCRILKTKDQDKIEIIFNKIVEGGT